MKTNRFAYDDPRTRCEPEPPFKKACNLITDCNNPECPRHTTLRASIAAKKAAKSTAARAATARDAARREA